MVKQLKQSQELTLKPSRTARNQINVRTCIPSIALPS
jgi:hypothetical protein